MRQNTPLELNAIWEGRNYYSYDEALNAIAMDKAEIQQKASVPLEHLCFTLPLYPDLPQKVDETFRTTYVDFFWRGYFGAIASAQMKIN